MPVLPPEDCGYCLPILSLDEIKMRRYQQSDNRVALEVEYILCLKDMKCGGLTISSRLSPISVGGLMIRVPDFRWPGGSPGTTPGPIIPTDFAQQMTTGQFGGTFMLPSQPTLGSIDQNTQGEMPDHSAQLTPKVCCLGDSSHENYNHTLRDCCKDMKEALCACTDPMNSNAIKNLGCGKANGGVGPTPLDAVVLRECCWVSCFKITADELKARAGGSSDILGGRILRGEDDSPDQTLSTINTLKFLLMDQFVFPDIQKSMFNLISACGYASGSRRGVFAPEEPHGQAPVMGWSLDCECEEDWSRGYRGWSCPPPS